MKYIIDTNIIYYTTETETNNGQKYKLTQTDEWHFTDIAILESVNRYKEDEQKYEKVKIFFQANTRRYLRYINSEYNPIEIFSNEYKTTKWHEACQRIVELKKRVESNGLKYANDVAVIVMTETLVNKFGLQAQKGKIFNSVYSYLVSNQAFVLKMIEDKIEEFYQDEKESKFKTEIQTVILMSIWVALQGILASSYDMDLEQYRIELAKDSPIIPKTHPLVIQIGKFTDKINDVGKRSNKWFETDSHLHDALNILDSSAQKYPEISLGLQLYLKALLKRIFSVGKKVFKNDLLDSCLLKDYPQYGIVSEDVAFNGIFEEMNKPLYDISRTYLLSLKSTN